MVYDMGFLESLRDILVESWIIKVGLSFMGSAAIWLMNLKHVQVLGVFILLVVFDLLTRWGAIAYQMLVEAGADKESISAWDKYVAIIPAFEKGLISSKHMRKPFVTKVMTYVFATAIGWCFDFMAEKEAFVVNLVWLYLASAEFLSVLENMRDGGNVMMGKFLDTIRDMIESKFKFKL